MKRLPSTQTLLAFEAAARHRSFTRAAEELALTHGAISQRIGELESELGSALFVRKGHGMQPTAFGEQLLAQVRPALAMLERTFTRRDAMPRLLRISTLPAFAAYWLMARLPTFRALHPEINLEIHASTSLTVSGEPIDLAIRYGPGGWAGVEAVKLCDETLTPVCAPTYRDVHDLRLPADIERTTLLVNPWQPWTPWLWAAGLSMTESAHSPRYADTGLLLQAAVAGDGLALGRNLLTQDLVNAGALVRPFEVCVIDAYAYYAVRFDRSRKPNVDIDLFISWLTEQLGSC